jgi:hypothetical protein
MSGPQLCGLVGGEDAEKPAMKLGPPALFGHDRSLAIVESGEGLVMVRGGFHGHSIADVLTRVYAMW